MSEREEELDVVFSAVFNSLLKNIHTAMPGRIVSFDSDNQTISVQPVLKRLYADSDEPENLPIIEDVPLVFQGSGDFWLTFDVKPDSYVLLIFSERSIANWLEQGSIVDPKFSQKFDLSDAIAIPGINPFPDKIENGFTSNGMTITSRDGNTQIDITANNIDIKASNITLNDPNAVDYAVAYTDLKAAFDQLVTDFNNLIILYNAHVHSGVTTGPGSTGPTAPPGTSSTADMSGARVDGVRVP